MDDIYRELVQACSTLIEGSSTTIFNGSRGIQKGDPFSPLPFIMVLEYLSAFTCQVVDQKHYETFTIGGVKVKPHLSFADDVINHSKSYATFSARVEDEDMLTVLLGFQQRNMSFTHLGIPIQGRT